MLAVRSLGPWESSPIEKPQRFKTAKFLDTDQFTDRGKGSCLFVAKQARLGFGIVSYENVVLAEVCVFLLGSLPDRGIVLENS